MVPRSPAACTSRSAHTDAHANKREHACTATATTKSVFIANGNYVINFIGDLKSIQGDMLSPLLFNFALEHVIRKAQGNQGGRKIKWDTSAAGLC
jgi:hypothetical protein